MNIDLNGHHAIVCGSTQGIGKAIATSLAECGAVVTLIARNKVVLESLVDTLPGSGHGLLVADFGNFEQLQLIRQQN